MRFQWSFFVTLLKSLFKCSPENLFYIFRSSFCKNTSGGLHLNIHRKIFVVLSILQLKFKKLLHKFDIKFLSHPFGNAGFPLFEYWSKTNKKTRISTAKKVSVLPVFLVRIFSHSDWITLSLRIQSECGKTRTRKASNTDIFHVGDSRKGEKKEKELMV